MRPETDARRRIGLLIISDRNLRELLAAGNYTQLSADYSEWREFAENCSREDFAKMKDLASEANAMTSNAVAGYLQRNFGIEDYSSIWDNMPVGPPVEIDPD
jgi:hypothetical protein